MIIRLSIALFVILFPVSANAEGLVDWWLTPDQQGRYYFEREDYQKSARSFEQARWKALAFYRAGNFSNAAALFEKDQSSYGRFMLGNALAKQEELMPAAAAYQEALRLEPDFPQATFNLQWVEGLIKLSEKEYEDVGGTGGKLGADRVVMDQRGEQAQGEVSAQQLKAEQGLSDKQIQDMWMRRVQTTPGDFLAYKFAYQLSQQSPEQREDTQ